MTVIQVEDREWTIPQLLKEAQRLRAIEPAKYDWDQLLDIVGSCDLGALGRGVRAEHLYSRVFRSLVNAQYGSTVAYLRERLGWPLNEPYDSDSSASSASSIAEDDEPFFTAEWARRLDGHRVRVLPNDWAYALPLDVQHFLVWSHRPILHPALCSEEEWEQAGQDGVSGFTGMEHGGKDGSQGAGRELDKFVKDRWPESEYETAWFVNPPRLQSVPELAHGHVFLRRKSA